MILDKLLNSFKKEKFFLELKENTEEVADRVGSVATKVKEEAQQLVEDSQLAEEDTKTDKKNTQKVGSSTVDSTSDSEQKEENKKELAKSSSATVKNQKDDSKEATTQATSAPSGDTSYSDEPFWVKLMYENKEQKAAQNAEKTFAPNHLISRPKARRRPGGSLDKFKEMARQTNVK